jgi:hypothetical protein
MRTKILLKVLVLMLLSEGGATALEPAALSPQPHPHLAESPYPIFHGNAWASGTQSLRGPEAQDEIKVDFIKMARGRFGAAR